MLSQKVPFTDEPNSGKLDHVLGITIFNLFLLLFLFLVCPGCVIPKDNKD